MTSRIKALALILFAVAGIAGCFQKSKSNSKNAGAEQISGAYEAFDQMSLARMYPFDKLPAAGFIQAWRFIQDMQPSSAAARSTDPWETLGPHNRAGRTLRIVFNPLNPNTMYAGSASGGLWRSYTGGLGSKAWHKIPTGFPVSAVSSIAFPANDSMPIFIGTGEVYNHQASGTGGIYRPTRGTYGIGILRSKDGGLTWTKSLDFTQDQNKGVWDVEVAPSDPNIVYAATTDGVYKSTNGGDSWILVHNVVLATDVAVHPTDPNLVVVGCGNQNSPGHGIYRSTNGGGNWTQISVDQADVAKGKIQLDYAKSNPSILYASIGNGIGFDDGASWLCRSNDFGAHWAIQSTTDYSRHQGWYSHDVAVSPTNPNELVVVGIDVWRSSNGGQVLTQKSSSSNGGIGDFYPPIEGPDGGPEFVHSDVHDAIWHPTQANVFYVADDGGIHRSTDGGQTFSSASARLQTAQFYNGFSNSATNEIYCIGGLQDNGTIRLTDELDLVTNSTVRWRRIGGGDGGWTGINQQNDQFFYASFQYLNIYNSVSLSVPSEDPVAFIAPFALAPSNGQVIYAGSAVVAKSIDGGNNWTITNNGQMLDGGPVSSMAISYLNEDIAYVTTAPFNGNKGNVFVTKNGGGTWEQITHNLPDRFYMDLELDPTNDAIAYIAIGGYGSSHLFRTKDYGETWEDIGAGLPDLPTNAIAVDPLFPTNIYVGNDLGVFSSVDDGLSWQTYLDGLPEAAVVFDLKISPANRKLRLATHGNGAYQRDLLETPYISEAKQVAMDAFPMEIFPNPASNKATLRYELSEKQLVTIEIMDNQGRLFKTVLWDSQPVGEYFQALPVLEMPSGIYYCRIKLGGRAGVKKLVVQKN
ncbi:MAG: T9SS type A sorting domain-containing protein [Saprospiraceae bacterium]|nr:T9SS type A sorting domain-containing protein [Saprospiraceae bacterium]